MFTNSFLGEQGGNPGLALADFPVDFDDNDTSPLREILRQRKLSALFQPVLDMRSGEIAGYEGLIRGPADSPLHSPFNLFGAAQRQGLSLETEMLSRQIVLETFAQLDLPGNLFLNVSPETLTHPRFKNGRTLDFMMEVGIEPERVIIELTENQPTYDFATMCSALLHYRSMGFQIALDDLGEGFSSLRLWSELRPDIVKIDMHFVQGVNADPVKLQFLKSIQCIAESCGTHVIAEGVESEAEFKVIKDLGIAYGQGYFIARPSPTPPLAAAPEIGCIIDASRMAQAVHCEFTSGRSRVTAQKLLSYIEPFRHDTASERIVERFVGNPALRVIPVVHNNVPVGVVRRRDFAGRFAGPHQRELVAGKSCGEIMRGDPIVVSKDMPIEELGNYLAAADRERYDDGFIIVDEGRYIGLASSQDLLRELTRMQAEAACYAHPLTLLPGNVPVGEHIERLLHAKAGFVACMCSLDNFKPFNDVYGYDKGDGMIQLAGRILSATCDRGRDFIGHPGGGDFVLVMQSSDWEKRCDRALESFAQKSVLLVSEPHRRAGGYESEDRNGNPVFHPLATLSIGAVRIEPGKFDSHHEVFSAAAGARNMARKVPGNSLFIEQRKHGRLARQLKSLRGVLL